MVDKTRKTYSIFPRVRLQMYEQNNNLESIWIAFSLSPTPALALKLYRAIGLETIKDLLSINFAPPLLL